jgi:hypothetical protein
MQNTKDRYAYVRMEEFAKRLKQEDRKIIYSAAKRMFQMGSTMQSRSAVHGTIEDFVADIGTKANLDDSSKTDLWQVLRHVAMDGLELRQDYGLTYSELQESRDYLESLCK